MSNEELKRKRKQESFDSLRYFRDQLTANPNLAGDTGINTDTLVKELPEDIEAKKEKDPKFKKLKKLFSGE